MTRKILLLLLCPLFAVSCLAQTQGSSESGLVITSIGPLHQLTQVLTRDTDINVINVPEQPRSLAAQSTFLSRQAGAYAELFQRADAVVTLSNLLPSDVLYTVAREANIRIVNIDASRPWSLVNTGIARAESPVNNEISPYFWTSPSNIIQSLGIIARDLQALYPQQADRIADNLATERSYYLELKAEFENRLLSVPDPLVFALADEFIYLTQEFGIFVEGYFVKQDINWTTGDLNRLTRTLSDAGVGVVIHKWEPSLEIRQAVMEAGAELVVLDLMETGTENFRADVRRNLERLLSAMSAP